jgi:hypothetical protein
MRLFRGPGRRAELAEQRLVELSDKLAHDRDHDAPILAADRLLGDLRHDGSRSPFAHAVAAVGFLCLVVGALSAARSKKSFGKISTIGLATFGILLCTLVELLS